MGDCMCLKWLFFFFLVVVVARQNAFDIKQLELIEKPLNWLLIEINSGQHELCRICVMLLSPRHKFIVKTGRSDMMLKIKSLYKKVYSYSIMQHDYGAFIIIMVLNDYYIKVLKVSMKWK